MLVASIIFVTLFIPSLQVGRPTLKLTFSPDETYYTNGHHVDIACELINPTEGGEIAQLWHVDFKTGRHTPISRQLINGQPSDAPEIFKKNSNKRLEYLGKNYFRIKHLQLEDSAEYVCNCPDCDPALPEQKKALKVMKLVEPKWTVGPSTPFQENAKVQIQCLADGFYPYVSHQIFHHHHDITNKDSNPVIPQGNAYPQKFSWEASVTPLPDWHNTTLRCTVTQGNHQQHAIFNITVLFTPRLVTCEQRQYVNSTKENATLSCSYAGNPAPTLTWFHQTDERPVKAGPGTGITIETIDEHHGRFNSILTFDREKLISLPITTTTMTTTVKSVNGKPDTASKAKESPDNYYQQILNDGFLVKLTYNNEDKGSRKIDIATDANEVRSSKLNNGSRKSIEVLSTSILISLLLTILYIKQYY